MPRPARIRRPHPLVTVLATGLAASLAVAGCSAAGPGPASPAATPPATPSGGSSTLLPGGATSPGAVPPAGPSSSPPPPCTAGGGDGPAPFPSAPPTEPARAAAVAYAAAFFRADRPPSAWWQDVAAHATPAWAAKLKTVNPGNIDARTIVGQPRVTSSTVCVVVFDFTTDRNLLVVTVIRGAADRWAVSSSDVRRPGEPT